MQDTSIITSCNKLIAINVFILLEEICGTLLEKIHEVDAKSCAIPLLNVFPQVK